MTVVVSLRPPLPDLPAAPAARAVVPGASTLSRFVAHGLIAVLDCYRAGGIPPHRFVRELTARIDQLAGLDVPDRTVTRLRWLARAAELHAGADPDAQAGALVELRAVLELLDPFRPLDPTGAGRRLTVVAG
jgi:hypothetical protein